MSGKISSASPNMQKPFQNVHWRKKIEAKIKMELQGTSRNYSLAIFKYFYFYMQLVLSCSLRLPLLILRSNCQQFFLPALHLEPALCHPFPPHLQASRDLGLTRQLWRGCYWLSVLAASHPFFQLCFETQSKLKKKKFEKKKLDIPALPTHLHQQRSHHHSLKHGCKRSSTRKAGKCSVRKKITLRKGTDFWRGRGESGPRGFGPALFLI